MIQCDGRVPIVCSANGLQPDGQNDNGWDQGLLFLDPSKVWLQPPGYALRMISRNHEPVTLDAQVTGADGKLDVTATRDAAGKTIVLRVANLATEPRTCQIVLDGFAPAKDAARVEELAGPLDAANSAANVRRIEPKSTGWKHGMRNGAATYTFPPHSFTVIGFE